jgi:putative ABC transport system permease protein
MTSHRSPGVLPLAWRQLWRDLRAGELRLLLFAVALAVAALTAVGFFADRLQAGLTRDARALLGGDAVIASDQPLPADFAKTARQMGLELASTASFPSMARATEARGGAVRLAAVKAVSSDTYPLRGELELQAGQRLRHGPARGEVWVEPAMLESLGLQLGDTLLLGDAALHIAEVIRIEPDRGTAFINFAPRVMLHEADLPATKLIQPASRVTWRLVVAAQDGRSSARQGETAVQGFVAWAQEQLDQQHIRGARIETLEGGRPEMSQTLDRAGQFLRLVAVLAALLAAVAVGMAARAFAGRHLDGCAMLRVLGLSQRRIASIYTLEFLFVGLAASALGVAIGFAVHHVFVQLLAGLVEVQLPAASLAPAAFGLGVGLTLLAAFGLPPVLQLARVPPLRVLRRDLGEPRAASAGVLLAGVAGFAALLMAAAADVKLGGIAVGGFGLAWGLFAAAAWAALWLLRRAVPEVGAPRWLVLASRQLGARPALAALQVSALALGLLALLLLVLLRTDLVSSWRAATPADAPNRFVINIQPDQAAPFRAALDQAGVARYDWYPMIRGRLVAVNQRDVKPDDYAEGRARRLVDREFNLSTAAQYPAHNTIVAGRWTPEEADGLSVEQGLAETLKLKLGDRLRFDIAGTLVEGRITSLRKVEWTSMRANFFVMFPKAAMPELPATYIAAFRAPATRGFDSALTREFPNITSVDVSTQIAQVQHVLDQVISAVEFLFGFTLVAGLLVLFAAVSSTRESRVREFALMRAMGARSSLLAQVQRAELLGVGALAGVLASLAASAIGWALAKYAFDFDWTPLPWLPLAAGLGGALLALAAGWWSLREVLQRPVSETLRRAVD